MAMNYPYVMTIDKFREFVRRLQTLGVPERVNRKYLQSLGYKSSNHHSFPKPLGFIGLIDDSGVPTPKYMALREGAPGKSKLGGYIREAYDQLYSTFPNAHVESAETLRDFFRAQTTLGDVAVSATVATFQALCQFAAFDETQSLDEGKTSVGTPTKTEKVLSSGPRPITINVNIQLSIPPTTDSEVYDKLFSSMAKYVKELEED
jgi:hypothetical protein